MGESVHDAERLLELQSLPLDRKIQISQARIIEWYQHWNGNVVVSFSGGKDSTVLLHLVRSIFPNVKAVFSNTGLEYVEIQKHVRTFDNVDIVTPEMRFDEVVSTYGYPLIGKEVAEAIYYARRIKTDKTKPARKNVKKPQIDRKRDELSGERFIQTSHARNRRTILQRKWKSTEEEGGGVQKKSQFNKEKWLPLARDVPVMVSHWCCYHMKKSPIHKYQAIHGYFPITGTLAEESRVRKQAWIRHGCNAFDVTSPISQPLSFWTEQDILTYIVKYDLPIASVYGDIVSMHEDTEYPAKDVCGNVGCNLKCTGCNRTGCIFCGFGLQTEKSGETRFQRLARTHPKQYEYSIGGGQWVDNPHYDPTAPKYDGEWKNWNPKQIWVPSKKGLGMGKVFDMVNEIYGKDCLRYE